MKHAPTSVLFPNTSGLLSISPQLQRCKLRLPLSKKGYVNWHVELKNEDTWATSCLFSLVNTQKNPSSVNDILFLCMCVSAVSSNSMAVLRAPRLFTLLPHLRGGIASLSTSTPRHCSVEHKDEKYILIPILHTNSMLLASQVGSIN